MIHENPSRFTTLNSPTYNMTLKLKSLKTSTEIMNVFTQKGEREKIVAKELVDGFEPSLL